MNREIANSVDIGASEIRSQRLPPRRLVGRQ
jgi:hypothetical protein